jgi:uncharacterized protein (TIGR00106 family)
MLVAFSVTPIGQGEDVGAAVARAVRVVRDSGLPNETNAMFTLIEGEWDEVMAVVGAAARAAAGEGTDDDGREGSGGRVSLVLKADIRPGVSGALRSKVDTVERLLRED